MILQRVVRAVNSFPEKFGEAWVPCMVAMTQGDLSVVSWSHVVTAYHTGIRAAIAYSVCCLLLKKVTAVRSAILIGFFTFISDLVTHPTHFGPVWSEALVTGCGATAIALLVDNFRSRMTELRSKKNETQREGSESD